MGKHESGNPIGTIPNVSRCNKCGKYLEIPGTRGQILDDSGTAHLSDLPREIFTNMAPRKCQAKLEFTKHQLDNAAESAYHDGWINGQQTAIGLRPEFSQQFFSKIRRNPNTKVFEVPEETYDILKTQFVLSPPPQNEAGL